MPEFDEAYVKKLREENASWRTKYRELEAQQHTAVIEATLTKRGIEASPDWVTFEEGQSVDEAVDALVARYPSLQKTVETPTEDIPTLDLSSETKPRATPRVMAPSTPKSTTPKAVTSQINSRNIAEIRKDPQARSKVRDLYRDLLRKGSNQGE